MSNSFRQHCVTKFSRNTTRFSAPPPCEPKGIFLVRAPLELCLDRPEEIVNKLQQMR